jgi:hypothetical protein
MKFTLRLPDDLAEALKKLAQKEKRSVHAQVLYILQVYIEKLKEEGKL